MRFQSALWPYLYTLRSQTELPTCVFSLQLVPHLPFCSQPFHLLTVLFKWHIFHITAAISVPLSGIYLFLTCTACPWCASAGCAASLWTPEAGPWFQWFGFSVRESRCSTKVLQGGGGRHLYPSWTAWLLSHRKLSPRWWRVLSKFSSHRWISDYWIPNNQVTTYTKSFYRLCFSSPQNLPHKCPYPPNLVRYNRRYLFLHDKNYLFLCVTLNICSAMTAMLHRGGNLPQMATRWTVVSNVVALYRFICLPDCRTVPLLLTAVTPLRRVPSRSSFWLLEKWGFELHWNTV